MADGARSNYINMRSGVPQGSVLGPCLFPAYINYLPVSSPSRIFADNIILYSFIVCAQDPAALQEDLSKLEQWGEKWEMSFHLDKYN